MSNKRYSDEFKIEAAKQVTDRLDGSSIQEAEALPRGVSKTEIESGCCLANSATL